ncbi:hypothetical protein [Mesorhizobium sp. M1252]|uniref:hypothetical protein n=1 Tax=Mesorhizobium sp. M1252 TaxID=2957073 RepID=UPI00333B00C3
MTGVCRVPNCHLPAFSRFSRHCRRHKSSLRRQGDPLQTSVTKGELTPYRLRVEARIAKNADSPLWEHLEGRWREIVGQARGDASKATGNRYQRNAAREVLNIGADAGGRAVMVTALAMFVLLSERPSRFASDAGFRLQLARRVRALSSRHSGSRYDHRTGREQRVYREMTPKAGAILGQTLATTFGAAGLRLAALDEQDREDARTAQENIRTAIKELK